MKARDVFAAVLGRSALWGKAGVAIALAVVVAVLAVPVTAGAAPPTVTLDPIAVHSITTAHASGEVTVDSEGNGGLETFWCFEVTPAGEEAWSQGTCGGPVAPATGEAVAGDLSGLIADQAYEVRLSFLNFTDFVTEFTAPQTFTTDPAVAPLLTAPAATEPTATSVHLVATVDPEGGNEDAVAGVLPIRAELLLSRDGGAGWDTVAVEELSGGTAEGTAPVEVEADATGLVPNSVYEARLLAHYAGRLETSPLPNPTFATPGVAPDVSAETLWRPTPTSIQLNARVNAHNSALTDCHFEYGTTTAYGQSAPCGSPLADGTYSPPADNSDHVVSARLSGLQPATEYHFRLRATNASEETFGEDRSFTTLPGAAAETCGNQARREEQHAGTLPDCRAWEMASPLEKGNGDVVGDGLTTVAAPDGGAVAFNSRAQFAGSVGSGVSGQSQYVARRGPAGWSTRAITPMARPDALQTFFAATKLQVFSSDLSTALVWGYDLPEASGDQTDRNSIYVEDTATRALQPITVSQNDPLTPFDFLGEQVWGVSDDARHVAFTTNTSLLPDAVGGGPYLYQWDEGSLTLAGRLEDDSVAPATVFPRNYRGAMSADGSRLAFISLAFHPAAQLYLRINGARTVWVSQPEGSDQSTPTGVSLEGMTRDGHTVFFVTNSALLNSDTNGGADLYRYTNSADPASDQNLTLISQTGDMERNTALGGGVIGFSEDGQRVYYHTLTSNIVLWDRGGTHLIASPVKREPTPGLQLTTTASEPGLGRVTPDGMHMAFATYEAPDTVHGPTGEVTNGHVEIYLYSLKQDTLKCVSCPSGGAISDASVMPDVTAGNPTIDNVGFRPQFLSDQGQVFFSTAEALVPEDTNGVSDAYVYDSASGRLSLLSSGQGGAPSSFVDASASGDDAFLLTRQRLISADTDELVDLYDARAGGGFTQSHMTSLACDGDACQDPPSSPPFVESIASTSPARGNLKQKRRPHRCTKKQRRAGKCRPHRHPNRGKGKSRAANSNRRASK